MTELLMIEQRQGSGDAAFWVREGRTKPASATRPGGLCRAI